MKRLGNLMLILLLLAATLVVVASCGCKCAWSKLAIRQLLAPMTTLCSVDISENA